MRDAGLTARMLAAGTVLFAFYAALAGVALQMGVGLPVVLAGTVLFVGVQWVLSQKLALRSVDAEDLPESEYPEIHERVADLSDEMGIEKPRLLVGRMGVPNAFAIGRQGKGTVVVSATLLDLLERDEVEGVLAHELAHLKNRDVVVMLLGQSVAAMLGMTVFWVVALLDDSIVFSVVGWLLSIVVQLVVSVFVRAISRYREYAADADAAAYTDDPEALVSALGKIHAVGTHEDAPDVSDNFAALCVFGGKRGLLAALFASHPPMEKRIARLRESSR